MCRTKLDILAGLTICARDMQRWRLNLTLSNVIVTLPSETSTMLTFSSYRLSAKMPCLIYHDKWRQNKRTRGCRSCHLEDQRNAGKYRRPRLWYNIVQTGAAARTCEDLHIFLSPELLTEYGFQLLNTLSYNRYWLHVPAFLIKHQVVIITQFVRISLSRYKHEVVKI